MHFLKTKWPNVVAVTMHWAHERREMSTKLLVAGNLCNHFAGCELKILRIYLRIFEPHFMGKVKNIQPQLEKQYSYKKRVYGSLRHRSPFVDCVWPNYRPVASMDIRKHIQAVHQSNAAGAKTIAVQSYTVMWSWKTVGIKENVTWPKDIAIS